MCDLFKKPSYNQFLRIFASFLYKIIFDFWSYFNTFEL
ncbi:hypothetical protein LEP1GSC151_1191 [Leptospira interrogans serovar Grippotyphosa str. LT2186]|uniref:Uncharacterized protein n=1 Tax=Leptospira interrogans serovar Grippotyphosa str. LT2186 TaxID=1001599 RepID=M3I1K9_LEPIR|nr:hypothetical protein LEP1GSC069_3506 [Leptospira interrogans serovar Canicola str. Fiocruz LV133]EKP84430.1 hypothetical protein LEP1GSC020_4425 [Leptospira interrogans serovar Grippotyphosa str. 2006006986]EKR45203.1 hypothetical protein LEP1GSC097_3372 [Leptospira interrogans serovar Grippotyphosa str. UI 08368]EMG09797.1 hypothetical protein LEP1GSC151_1191 [Leptospira interrogans serovar Grippotyphosa str. LT2186]EMI61674.1 hypothetical protein LEP1GSC200_3292 [Leptospira interrogans ser